MPSSAISVLSIIFPSFIPLTGSNLYHEIGRKIPANMHTIQNITGVGVRYKTWHNLSESTKLFHLQTWREKVWSDEKKKSEREKQLQTANFMHLLRRLQNGQPTLLFKKYWRKWSLDGLGRIWNHLEIYIMDQCMDLSNWTEQSTRMFEWLSDINIFTKLLLFKSTQTKKPGWRSKMWYEI